MSLDVTIYCRISLDRTGDMLGVERQEKECREYCERQGWTVREVLVDNDISATSGKRRPAFERLLTSKPEGIVVWHTDRLVRLSKELLRVIEIGVNVHAVHAGHIDLSTPAGRAVAKTITAWAEYEGEQKSLRQQASHRQRAEAGRPWWTRRPFGYEPDGTLRVTEADAVRAAYREFVAGRMTLTAIAEDWNVRGLKTWKGGPWSQSSVHQLLRNPRNAAIATRHGEEVGEGNWTPIVDEATYRAAFDIFTSPDRNNGGGGRRKGLLVGVAMCGKCGSGVRVSTNGRSGKQGTRIIYKRVYVCNRSCTTHPIVDVDDYVNEIMVGILANPAIATLLPGAERSEHDFVAEREALVTRKRALGEDYADHLIDRAEFRRLRARQNERLAQLDMVIKQSTLDVAVLEGLPDLTYMAANWFDPERVTDAERRQAISAFLIIALNPRKKGERTYDVERSVGLVRITDALAKLAEQGEDDSTLV